jgi:hypothetical protein
MRRIGILSRKAKTKSDAAKRGSALAHQEGEVSRVDTIGVAAFERQSRQDVRTDRRPHNMTQFASAQRV